MARQLEEKYEVEPDQLNGLREAISQLSIGANRHGLGPIDMRIVSESEAGVVVALATPMPALGDYRPLARIEHLKSGKVSITPLTQNRVDFAEIRSERSAQKCDACGVRRRRRLTFLLANSDGREVQVGSTCLASFVGESDPRKALHQADVFAKVRQLVAEATAPERVGERTGLHPTVPTVSDFLGHVAAVIREEGRFVPLSEQPVDDSAPTARLAIENYRLEQSGLTDDAGSPHWIEVTDLDRERAARRTTEFISRIDAKPDPVGFEKRLRSLLDKDFAWPAYQGILATLLRGRSTKPTRLPARDEWLGEVGESFEAIAKVNRISKPVASKYGGQVPHSMTTEDGHVLSWFATNLTLELDRRYLLKGEIRSLREYRGDHVTVVAKCEYELID